MYLRVVSYVNKSGNLQSPYPVGVENQRWQGLVPLILGFAGSLQCGGNQMELSKQSQ